MSITKAQLTRLQTCYAQMARSVIGFENTRNARIDWACGIVRRPISSFSELSQDEARRLIDIAQGEIGHRAPAKPRQRRSPQAARRHGVDGRKGDAEFANAPQIVSPQDMENIRERYQRLGMTNETFGNWLASRSSPIRPRKQIRTTADANRVLWALKGMLKDRGLWADWGNE